MFEVRQTNEYATWYSKLLDVGAKARIDVRIRRMSLGNLGDVKFLAALAKSRSIMGRAIASTS